MRPDAGGGRAASGGAASATHGRTDLFENLLAHRATGAPLLSSLVDAGAYMEVLEAIRTHEEPLAIDPAFVTWQGDGDAAHPVVADIDWWVQRTAAAGALFSEMRVPWAVEAPGGRREPVVVGEPSGVAPSSAGAVARCNGTRSGIRGAGRDLERRLDRDARRRRRDRSCIRCSRRPASS